jgi:uncharacterized protein (TIGR02453 family)
MVQCEHRGRYLAEVRDPLLGLVAALAPKLRAISPHTVVDPRPSGGSLLRIYRDTRFSADKKPYKTNAALFFRLASGKDVETPGGAGSEPGAWSSLTTSPRRSGHRYAADTRSSKT